MVSSFPRRAAVALVLILACYCLFFHGLTGTGLLGPDEPRYASIGREMARSGDWITPRLWGDAWFEKPPLLYWMIAAGFECGLGDDLAPRLPVALFSLAFLAAYFWLLRREFGDDMAVASTAILATSALWMGFTHVGATDLPMAAAFSLAMLFALRWTETGDRKALIVAAVLEGLAVLAKGLVPIVLALPLLWFARRRWRDLLSPWPAAAFLIVAGPWYAAVTARHGTAFLTEFFLKHHLERLATDSLRHVQPFWFYAPVLIGALVPWTPLLALLFRRSLYEDRRARFLLAWFAFGFVFFSAANNKLPGYVLPLIPAAAALAGLGLTKCERPRTLLATCAALLGLIPITAAILPDALLRGLSRASAGSISWALLIPVGLLAIAVVLLTAHGRRREAVLAIAGSAVLAVVWLEQSVFPVLDRDVSARALWRQAATHRNEICVDPVNRGWRYNLNYYSVTPLPDCGTAPKRLRITQPPGRVASLTAAD